MARSSPVAHTLAGLAGVLAVFSCARIARAAEDVSSGGVVESDLYEDADSPPSALIDGSIETHYAHQRVEDAEWRVRLPVPATLESVTFVQGWSDWSQAMLVRLESADGSTIDLDLQAGTREPQSFPLTFPGPTAFVDVHVLAAAPGSDGGGWGGFAEMTLLGTRVPDDTTAPIVSGIEVVPGSASLATIRWQTNEPATSQLRFSTELTASTLTDPALELVTQHEITVLGDAPLRGLIEIRSADAAGNRAEVREEAFVTIDTSWQLGAGGWTFPLDGGWVPAADVYAQDGVRHGFTQAWIGGDGWTDWMTAESIAEVRAAGLTPELIHYFFGDPVLADVQARREEFLADIGALADVLAASGVGPETLVTLEPEYNQNEVATWESWNDLMIEAMTLLRTRAGAKVGLLPGDWDIQHVTPISMGRAAAYADFVAFQEMRASTRDTPEEAAQVVSRAIRFSHYLSRRFLRPVRWGYLMVSDHGAWTREQHDVVTEMCERQQELRDAGTVAVSWMSYLDDDASGGYFGEAERHKGLKYADNTPKPAWTVWKECSLNGPSWLATGAPPPGQPAPDEPAPASGCGCGVACRGGFGGAALLAAALLCIGAGRRRTRPR